MSDLFSMDSFSKDSGVFDGMDIEDTDENEELDDEATEDVVSKEKIDDVEKDVDDESIEDEEEESGEDSLSNNSDSPYSALITTLGESLPYLSGEKIPKFKNSLELSEYLENKIEEEVSAREFKTLTDSQKDYLEALKAGVPEERVKQTLSFESSVNSITDDAIEDDADLREQVIYQAAILNGMTEVQAKKYTKRSIDSGEDIDDAKESLESLKSHAATRKQADKQAAMDAKLKAKEAHAASMQKLKDNIDNPKDVLGETSLTTKYKKELYNYITTPQEIDGKPVDFLTKLINDDPINTRIAIAHLAKLTNGFKPELLKSLNPKRVKSDAHSKLDDALSRANSNSFRIDNEDDQSFFNSNSSGVPSIKGFSLVD